MKTASNPKAARSHASDAQGAAIAQLESELRATDLLALNATIKSAQEGVTGEDLFAVLQRIRQQTRSSLEHLLNLGNQNAQE